MGAALAVALALSASAHAGVNDALCGTALFGDIALTDDLDCSADGQRAIDFHGREPDTRLDKIAIDPAP